MSQKVTVVLFNSKNYRKYYHILQLVAAESTWESGCLHQLMESKNLNEREAAAFKSGMCVCMYMCICFKYYAVMTYSYKYCEAI